MSENTIQSDTTEAESIANVVSGVVSAVDPAVGAVAAEGLQAAEGVANAVEAAAPHATAVADIGTAVTALAATPIVQSNAQAAAIVGLAASFAAWLKSEFAKL